MASVPSRRSMTTTRRPGRPSAACLASICNRRLFQRMVQSFATLRGSCQVRTNASVALVLTWQEPRSVANDWTIRWNNRRLQIDARHAALGLPGRRVVVIERRDGTLAILYRGRMLTFRDAPAPTTPA